nr:MAG TPA: hypothetical protein [Caudoviricetes sp.]
MTIQEFIDNAFTLHWIEDAKTYKNELVFVDIEDVVLARIPLDITPKTDMSEVYINKTYLEPEDIEQLKKWLLEFSKTPLRERDKSVRVYSETSEIDQALTDLIDDVIEFVYADYTDRQRTDEERQEAFSKLLWHKNIILRKLKKRDSRRSASRHRSVFFENKKIEDIICEIDKRIPATRAKLERLYNKRKRLQHD